jgi:threonyl-tRNA synthetase
VAILPISDRFNEYAEQVLAELKNSDIRGYVDDRAEKIGKKIRDNELKKVPFMLIVGEKEAAEGLVSVRRQGDGDKGAMSISEFANLINSEVNERLQTLNN